MGHCPLYLVVFAVFVVGYAEVRLYPFRVWSLAISALTASGSFGFVCLLRYVSALFVNLIV